MKTTDCNCSRDIWDRIQKDQSLRRELCRKDPYWFFHIYFPDYIKYPTAEFQKEMFRIVADQGLDLAVVVAFRGSGKSTIMGMVNTIWSVVGEPQKKFSVLLSLRQQQAELNLSNIRYELENNALLNKDFGPFYSSDSEWSSTSLVVKKYGARITVASTGETVRGIRSRSDRPDLIICDDIEDLDSVSTQEGRDKTSRRFNGEIRPLGDTRTKIVVIGNLLHEDSLIVQLRRYIEDYQSNTSLFRAYPLISDEGKCLWSEKYSDEDSIKKLRTGLTDTAWLREYLLQIVPEGAPVIESDWLQYYDGFPTDNARYRFLFTLCSVDPAISEKSTADYTAIVHARVYKDTKDNSLKVYLLPDPTNERFNFPDAVKKIISENWYLNRLQEHPKWILEDTAFQRSLIQVLEGNDIKAEGVKPNKGSKRERLVQASLWIKNGNVLLPQSGVDLLKAQLTGYGIERHDDLCDALTQMVLYLMEKQESLLKKEECFIIQGGYASIYDHSYIDRGEGNRLTGHYTEMVNGKIVHGHL